MPLPTTIHPPRHQVVEDQRPVAAVIDLDSPGGTSLRSALATAAAYGSPLQVLLLGRRAGFTTDPALLVVRRRRLQQAETEVLATARALAAEHRLPWSSVTVRQLPYRRWPFQDPTRAVRRALDRVTERERPRLVLLPLQLRAAPTTHRAERAAAGLR